MFSNRTLQAVFSKFFAGSDREQVLAAIPPEARRVVFIDTPSTGELVSTVETLVGRGVEVILRDHHDVLGEPRSPRDREIRAAADRLRALLGAGATISTREKDPACSSLLAMGEFALPSEGQIEAVGAEVETDRVSIGSPLGLNAAEASRLAKSAATWIVADPDADGLTAACKARGITYPSLDKDAAVLDGPQAEQNERTLSSLAMLLVKGLATLPPFDQARPQVSEEAKGKLFAEFAAAAGGDAKAVSGLQATVSKYEAAVTAAEAIASAATEVAPGVWMAETVGRKPDLSTLTQRLEARSGCAVTVVRKDNGPIAAKCGGIQISLAVVKAHQSRINLQQLVPPNTPSSLESGRIFNTTFLLHVSQERWEKEILPALRATPPK